jgi:hypothetical protein
VSAARGLAQALGVAQALALGRQFRLLVRIGPHRLDLRELVAEKVEVPLAGTAALAQLGQLGRQAQAFAMCVPVTLAQL